MQTERGCCQTSKKVSNSLFLLFELNILRFDKKVGIAFIGDDTSNSAESFGKMGCGEDNLFSKRCLSRRIIFATATIDNATDGVTKKKPTLEKRSAIIFW